MGHRLQNSTVHAVGCIYVELQKIVRHKHFENLHCDHFHEQKQQGAERQH